MHKILEHVLKRNSSEEEQGFTITGLVSMKASFLLTTCASVGLLASNHSSRTPALSACGLIGKEEARNPRFSLDFVHGICCAERITVEDSRIRLEFFSPGACLLINHPRTSPSLDDQTQRMDGAGGYLFGTCQRGASPTLTVARLIMPKLKYLPTG